MKDALKIIGGLLVVLAIITAIPLIWSDNALWTKIFCTEIVMIIIIWILDGKESKI